MRSNQFLMTYGGSQFLGDLLSVRAVACYALRRLYSSYSGFCLRVRKTVAGFDYFLDIGFTSSGDLDIAALLAFASNADNGNVWIQTFYDLSGNGFHQIQNVNTAQARIVANSAFVQPTYSGSFYTGNLSIGHPLTINAVAQNTSTATSVRGITGRGASRAAIGILNAAPAANAFALWTPTVNRGIYANGTVSTNPIIISALAPSIDESTWRLFLNGATPSTVTETSGTPIDSGSVVLGASNTAGEGWIGTISEVWYSTFSASDLAILHRDQGAYYGISVS